MSSNESSIKSSLARIEQLSSAGRIKDAKELAIKTEHTWSDDKRVSRFIGMFLVTKSWYPEFEMAANMLEKSLSAFPGDADMHNLYSYACWVLHRREGAIMGATRAIAIDPKGVTGYLRLGMLYLTEGRHAEAFTAFSEGIACCQDNEELLQWHKLAEALANNIRQVNLVFDGECFTFGISANNGSAMTTSCYHIHGSLNEPEELAFLRRELGTCNTIVECGILVGNHLIYFMKTLSPRKIIAFDADSWCISETHRNIELNQGDGMTTHIELHHKAVGNTNETITFDGQSVECIALNDQVTETVDFLKVDVDGMELQVIEGALELIKRSHPKIMIEINWENMPAFLDRVKEIHYTVKRQFDKRNYSNLFLVPECV